MANLEDATDARFVRAEARQLALFAPALAATSGLPGLEEAVHLSLRMARRAGFTEGPQVRLCAQLMTTLGAHFDADPQYRWLHPFLQDTKGLTTGERARLLHWHATLYINRAYGPKRVHGIAAARRLSELDQDSLAAASDLPVRLLPARLHPERIAWFSDAVLGELRDKAAAEASRHGLGGRVAVPLLLSLMFSFGHGIADDPLYPWVRETLAMEIPDGAAKTDALLIRTRASVSTIARQLARKTR